ncbi:type I restriction enzyme HsdR N-terminal domain-containing protein [uncultured Methanobrevibacter sp.]|uniref:type I restriction enzyme HsdR N-terminal domain-containing protein n=1 Tax=uncultured Methanobrevibacter sp. TaxID=253161 RepID=UPI0025CF9A8A|nr:type I restriction enzyme HsdR N-terminal domain-containing protein [uncultured Methanobrevibacter sp.]
MESLKEKDIQINSIPSKKIKCFITGKLRKNTPEERVRQDFARLLVEIYGYSIKDMDAEFTIKMGREKKKADIVIFKENEEHLQENIIIIVEVKKEDVSPSDKKEGVDQLKSYCSASIKCEYGIWAGNEKIVYKKLKINNLS